MLDICFGMIIATTVFILGFISGLLVGSKIEE